jgi:hypothetical protein
VGWRSASTAGAVYTVHLPSLASHTGTIIYNSIKQYQGNQQPVGKAMSLSSAGDLSDTLGAIGFDYQVKIYKIN